MRLTPSPGSGPKLAALLPSPQEQLLLDAALAGPERAVPSFSAWIATIDLRAEVGWELVRLLPLAFHNLRAHGVNAPVLGRFKGVYRRTWYLSQQVLHRTRPAVVCLQAHGIEPLVLDDAALALTCYAPPALRPVTRLDLLVQRLEVRPAALMLKKAGWRGANDGSADDLRFADYLRLLGPEDAEVRLRWEVLPGGKDPADGQSGWSAGAGLDWPGAPVSQLDPSSQLLRTIVQRHRPDDAPSFHWVADALMLLRKHAGAIEWPRLLATAAAHRVTGLLAIGCGYLTARFGAVIPAAVLTLLERHRGPLMERLADAALLSLRSAASGPPPQSRDSIRVEFLRYFERTRRLSNPVRTILEFSHLLRYRWKLSGRREILATLFRDRAGILSSPRSPR